MSGELAIALQSAQATYKILSAALQMKRQSEIEHAVREAHQALSDALEKTIAAQTAHLALRQEADELRAQVRRLQDWEGEKQRYEAREVARGVFAYVDKAHVGTPESAVKLCPACYESHRKSPLQQEDVPVGRMLRLTCFACKANVTFYRYLT